MEHFHKTKLRAFMLCVAVVAVSACNVPQPGDPDYERYLKSKADRAERLYEGF